MGGRVEDLSEGEEAEPEDGGGGEKVVVAVEAEVQTPVIRRQPRL